MFIFFSEPPTVSQLKNKLALMVRSPKPEENGRTKRFHHSSLVIRPSALAPLPSSFVLRLHPSSFVIGPSSSPLIPRPSSFAFYPGHINAIPLPRNQIQVMVRIIKALNSSTKTA